MLLPIEPYNTGLGYSIGFVYSAEDKNSISEIESNMPFGKVHTGNIWSLTTISYSSVVTHVVKLQRARDEVHIFYIFNSSGENSSPPVAFKRNKQFVINLEIAFCHPKTGCTFRYGSCFAPNFEDVTAEL